MAEVNIDVAKESTCQQILEKMGEGEGVTAKVIKSFQRVTYQPMRNTTEGSVSIAPVDAAKCIVLFERLEDNSQYTSKMNYTLTDTSIELTFPVTSTDSRLYGFWVIELY